MTHSDNNLVRQAVHAETVKEKIDRSASYKRVPCSTETRNRPLPRSVYLANLKNGRNT